MREEEKKEKKEHKKTKERKEQFAVNVLVVNHNQMAERMSGAIEKVLRDP